jgi:hypothetical protein
MPIVLDIPAVWGMPTVRRAHYAEPVNYVNWAHRGDTSTGLTVQKVPSVRNLHTVQDVPTLWIMPTVWYPPCVTDPLCKTCLQCGTYPLCGFSPLCNTCSLCWTGPLCITVHAHHTRHAHCASRANYALQPVVRDVPAAYYVPTLHDMSTWRGCAPCRTFSLCVICPHAYCVLPLHFHFVLYAQSKGCAHCMGHAHRAGRAQYVRHAVCANSEGRSFGVGRSNVRNVPTVRECPPMCYMSTMRDLTRTHL